MTVPTTLYRMHDAAGQLLYVGITMDVERRFGGHRRGKPWWPMVATIALQHFPDRNSARAAELAAIAGENPVHNIADAGYRQERPARDSIIAHYALHEPGEWCQSCDTWPHTSLTGPDGWCTRCDVHANDHEWDNTDWALYSREQLSS